MPDKKELTQRLAHELSRYQTAAVQIQELFEQLLPVGEQVTAIKGGRALEVRVVKHHSHKRKAKLLVRDIYSGTTFDTDLAHLIVPGIPDHLRAVDPPELPEPGIEFKVTSAADVGIQVPDKCDVTAEQIEYARHDAVIREGERRRPPRHGQKPKYPFWALLPGDTFYTESVAPARLRSAAGQKNNLYQAQYAVRAEPPGIRVYRLK